MQAKFWTTTGEDIWKLEERRIFRFTNLQTGEELNLFDSREVMDAKLQPVKMPNIKPKEPARPKRNPGPKPKPKYKGVSVTGTPGKWRAQFWDKEKNKNIYLGTFDSELLAAAAIERHKGNTKEAIRLINEYHEGNCRPEVNPGEFPSEE